MRKATEGGASDEWKVSAIVDYSFQMNGMDVPENLREGRLLPTKPYYRSERINDFDKVKLMHSSPAPFHARNVYLDLNELMRM